MQPGTLLGAYRIDGPLGEGGMSVVFSATDTKLQRAVAIKFLSNEVADSEARRRFQREAELVSSLNHPHILTVHDAGDLDGRQYLVTELVDGGTLKDWAALERRSWRQIVDLLVGVADGLATAHQAGILHRDVKPRNVLVAKNGYAKLADFGLARMWGGTLDERANTLTLPEGITSHGLVIGTLAYMSPEQVAGRTLDARSDIFSFGIVLYELLQGKHPFLCANELETLQTIAHGTPPPLRADTPLALRLIVEKALEKDPADRYQSMREMVVDLRRVARRTSADVEAPPAPAAVAKPRGRMLVLGAAGLLAALAIGAAAGRWSTSAVVEPPAPAAPANVQFHRLTDFVGMEGQPAISPDGKWVAFVAGTAGRQHIWVRLLAGGAPVQVTTRDGDYAFPRWTPDSTNLIYFVAAQKEGEPGMLWEVAAVGGTPRALGPSLGEGDVSHDGRRIATFRTQGESKVLAILSRDGSSMQQALAVPPMVTYATPRWSPDDRRVAFNGSSDTAFSRGLYVLDATGGEARQVAAATNIQGLAWLPDGSGLVYASATGSTLVYPPIFNLRTVSLDGARDRQLTFGDLSHTEPDVSAAGTLVTTRVRMQSDIWRFPIDGPPAENVRQGLRVTRQTGQVQTPTPSPDGSEVAYLSDAGGHGNIWIARLDGSRPRQLTHERDPGVTIGVPVWSPGGDGILVLRSAGPARRQILIQPDGSGQRELTDGFAAVWSRDGKWLYYTTGLGLNTVSSCVKKIASTGGSEVPVRCDANSMAVSSDQSWLYYSPHTTKQYELWRSAPTGENAQLIARVAPTRIPLNPHGYALSPDDRWLATPLKDGGTTNIWAIPATGGPMRQLTDFGTRPTLIGRQISWSADGKYLFAAVIETDADVVLLDGLLRQ